MIEKAKRINGTELVCQSFLFAISWYKHKKIQFNSKTTVFISIVTINSKYNHRHELSEVLQELSSFRTEINQ